MLTKEDGRDKMISVADKNSKQAQEKNLKILKKSA